MITKQEFEVLQLDLKAKIYKMEVIIEDNKTIISENILNEDVESEIEIKLACRMIEFCEKEIGDLKDMLYDLYYRYNSQFAKPIPNKAI